MKAKLLLMILAVSGMAFQACNDDNDPFHRNPAAERTFKTMYEGATSVKWEAKRGYSVVDFRYDGYEREAWYDRDGVWHMTETDLPNTTDLPPAVKTSFEAGEYKLWRVEDIDMVQRKDIETIYIIEVEQGNQEYDLYYTEDGTLVKAVPDTESDNDYLPPTINATVTAFLADKYPGYKIIEAERENGNLEVDIIVGSVIREVVFNSSSAWLYTKTAVLKAEVPATVIQALEASIYSTYFVGEIDQYLTADNKEYYIFDLENNGTDVDVRIDIDGAITVVG